MKLRRLLVFFTIYGLHTFTQAAYAGSIAHVLVAIPPATPLVTEIMRGTGKPQNLFDGAQDLHSISLTPAQARRVANANVIIVADTQLNPSLNAALLKRAAKDAVLIGLTDLKGAQALPYRKESPFANFVKNTDKEVDIKPLSTKHKNDHHKHHQEHSEGKQDPHIWLDPIRMANILPALATRLGEIQPEHAATFENNAQILSTHLRETVSPAIAAVIHNARPSRTPDVIPYVTYHDSYQYFDIRYGIKNRGFITQKPEEYIGASSMKSLLEASGATQIRCIIAESNSGLTNRLAVRAEASVIVLSPERLYPPDAYPTTPWAKTDYDRLLHKIARVFAGCIEGDKS